MVRPLFACDDGIQCIANSQFRILSCPMRWTLLAAGLSGLVAIGFGAWSAHGAEAVLGAQALGWVKTAVQYQAWHSLALLATGVLMAVKPGRFLPLAAGAFTGGIVLFSGSLYLLAFTGWRGFAYPVPLGGIGMLAGWLFLAVYAFMLDRR
jgi:uncharacterized membrane protein YgdD (TMEM256/DUF423 family)